MRQEMRLKRRLKNKQKELEVGGFDCSRFHDKVTSLSVRNSKKSTRRREIAAVDSKLESSVAAKSDGAWPDSRSLPLPDLMSRSHTAAGTYLFLFRT
mmetsp:Transcript_26452/g.86919  ORF Transcript_26452/g.86919 Transcript_26452/m.86919 type:complete len:97 (+) Transcript_26452:2104-2394(+)